MKHFRSIPTFSLSFITFLSLSLACSNASEDETSTLKIRNGRQVESQSEGPERVSTAGLLIYGPKGQSTCSAAIIEENALVTAAHCIEPQSVIFAYFGADMRSARQEDFIPVQTVSIFPLYEQGGTRLVAEHDIAVVHLERSIPEAFRPAPILPSDNLLQTNDTTLLAGFGIDEFGSNLGLLRYTPATFAGVDRLGRLTINDRSFRGACSGDSGGPLFATIGETHYVAGVLSGGPIPCRGINSYTSLARYRAFIDQSLARLGEL